MDMVGLEMRHMRRHVNLAKIPGYILPHDSKCSGETLSMKRAGEGFIPT